MDGPSTKPDSSKLKIEDEIDTEFKNYFWALFVILILVIAYFFLIPKSAVNIPNENPIASNTYQNRTDYSDEVLNATGYVIAQRKAAVSSKATGRLKVLNVAEGDTVKADQQIGMLENDDLIALVQQAEANLQSIAAQVSSAEANLENANLQYVRISDLHKQKVVSNSDLDNAMMRQKTSEADLNASKANLNLAQAQLEKAKVDLSFTYILAPFDGTVLTKDADQGEIIAPFGSSTNSRASIVTIADMSSLEVEADVSESNISKIFIDQECEITLDSFADKQYKGQVTKIVPTVNRAKSTVLVKIKFLNIDSSVLPEMSAKVAFKSKAVEVPTPSFSQSPTASNTP